MLVKIAEINIAVTGPERFFPNDVFLSSLKAAAADDAMTAYNPHWLPGRHWNASGIDDSLLLRSRQSAFNVPCGA